MNPKIYIVGGHNRDTIMGLTPKDTDYVVVGATLQWMLDQGFKQVGASFPVFLHPETGDEYAMARREKKTAPGYQGFEFEFGQDVTLEEDLSRRDLCMCSIAYDTETQEYIDPFDGMYDIKHGIIRHTSDAFAEDPLRVLRVARFAARYDFKVSYETFLLCKKLVNDHELDALSSERIWIEFYKMFSEERPSIGLQFLDEVGALNTIKLHGLVNRVNIYDIHKTQYMTESLMSSIEKMFCFLNIQHFSNDQIDLFRIPHDVVRLCNFYKDVTTLSRNIDSIKVDPTSLVKAFDKYRNEIKSELIRNVRTYELKIHNLMSNGDNCIETYKLIIDAFNRLLSIDFTESVKLVPPSKIKEFVLITKITTVLKSFKGE